MRKVATTSSPDAEFRRAMIYDSSSSSGVFLFLFRALGDGPCDADYWHEDMTGVRRAPFSLVWRTALIAAPALVLPFLIRGFVGGGVATATEVSTVAVVYALVIGMVLYGGISLRTMGRMLVETAALVAAGFSGHGFKLCPAVGKMVAALVAEGPAAAPDAATFRLSRFAEGKPIRGTYGDWLMC